MLINSISKLESECFGGESESSNDDYRFAFRMFDFSNFTNAYMLVYERKLKTLMKKIADPIIVEEHKDSIKVLECENTALARAGEVYFDPEKKEYLIFTKFNDVAPKVPKNYFQEVWEDNNTLIFERQIYSTEFFTFVQEILNESYTLLDKLPKESANEMAISMTHISSALISEILAHAYYNSAINPIVDKCVKLFSVNEVATNEFLTQFINSDHNKYMHLLLKCPDKDVREAIGKLLTETLTIAIGRDKAAFDFTIIKEGDKEIHQYNSLVARVLGMLIELIDPKFAQDWNRFGQFFKLLLNVTKNGGESVVLYMNEANLITILLDFYLENSSPLKKKKERMEMGNRVDKPKFSFLIDLLCHLLSFADLSFLQPNYSKLQKEWNLPNILYVLSEDAKRCLLCKEFLTKTIFEGYTTESFNKLLTILSYEFEQFSKRLAKIVLSVINGDITVDVNTCFNVLKKIFSIEDSLQQKRFEWLLGIPALTATVSFGTEETIKCGLRHINYLDEAVIDYVSPLTYNNHFNSLLTLLWKFNKSFEIAPTKCLLDLMITNPKIFEYIITTPPPTYQYAKYPDWIKCFVVAFTQNNQNVMRFTSYFYSAKKAEDFKKAVMYVVEYEKLWVEFVSKQKPYTDRTDVLLAFPPPYLIGKMEEEKLLYIGTKEDVTLRVSEIRTETFRSFPSGAANDGIPSCYAEKTKLRIDRMAHNSPKRVSFEDIDGKKEDTKNNSNKKEAQKEEMAEGDVKKEEVSEEVKDQEPKKDEAKEEKKDAKVEPLGVESTVLQVSIKSSMV